MNENLILITVKKEELENLIENAVQNAVKQSVKVVEPEQLLKGQEAADLLGIDPSTLWHWRKKSLIKAHALGSRIFYKRSEIMEALTELNNKKGGEK